MSKYYGNTDYNGKIGSGNGKRRRPWITFLKVFCWCVGILVVLCGIAIWIIAGYMNPNRIVHLIEEHGSEYLDARIKIGDLKYKLWRTYPWFEFEVDSLTIISTRLDHLNAQQRKELPECADSLASVMKLTGSINIHDLFHKEVSLRDLEIIRPEVNIVVVNDTLNNYDIARKLPKISLSKIPKIKFPELKIISPVNVSIYSLPEQMEAFMEVENFQLAKSDKKTFEFDFEGTVDGKYGDYTLPAKVPVKFNTQIRSKLHEMTVSLKDLSLEVAGIGVYAFGEIKAKKNKIDLSKAQFRLTFNDLFALMQYLPEDMRGKVELPDGLSGVLPLRLDVNLLSPFLLDTEHISNMTLQDLPDLHASLNIDNAELNLVPPGGKRIYADDIYMEVEGDFYPDSLQNTHISIPELRLRGEGIALDGSGMINNLLGDEQTIEAELAFNSPLMETLRYFLPKNGVKISGFLQGEVKLNAIAQNLGRNGVKDVSVKGDLSSRALNLSEKSSGQIRLKNMKSDFHAIIPAYPLTNYTGTKIFFLFKTDSLAGKVKDTDLFLTKLELSLDMLDTVSGAPDPDGDLIVKIKELEAVNGGNEFRAQDIDLKSSGTLQSSSSSNYSNVATVSPSSGVDDTLIASRDKHTPLVLTYNGGGLLQTLISMLKLDADINLGRCSFRIPQYLYSFELMGLNLSTNLNDIKFTANNLKIGDSGCGLTARLDGLGPFLTSYSATPLKATAEINFSNVDINQLSWGYYGTLVKAGKDSVFYVPPVLPYTAADSVCVVIPRNIEADIKLHSNSAEYMNYRFAPLSTDIIVKNGAATLKQLTIGAPYCTAVVDWTYSTTQLDNIYMDLKAKVKNFSFESFYGVFPALISKAPELKNFTGMLNAGIDCRFGMYPSMFMNPESMTAKFNIQGSQLMFAREGKIERITHLMLIDGDAPIHIQNLDITGGYHSNLLQVNPFKIEFDDYEFSVGGINNAIGEMYYHFALEKSPFHLPFGVTLKGNFSHPEVSLGGTHIDDYEAEKVSPEVSEKFNVNIMSYLQNGWQLFLKEAAKFRGGMEDE